MGKKKEVCDIQYLNNSLMVRFMCILILEFLFEDMKLKFKITCLYTFTTIN